MRARLFLWSLFVSGLILPLSLQGQDLPQLLAALEEAYEEENYGDILSREAEVVKGIGNTQSLVAADLLSLLGEAHLYEGEIEEAQRHLEKSYAMYQALNATKEAGYGDAVYNLAYLHMEQRNYAKAEGYAQELLASDKSTYGVNSYEYVSTLLTLFDAYRGQNKLKEAQSLGKQALRQVNKETENYYLLQNSMADLYVDLGQFSDAEALLLPALDQVEALYGGGSLEYCVNQGLLATLYKRWGRFAESERLFLDALDRLDRAAPSPTIEAYTSTIQNNLASMYSLMARHDEAIDLYTELLTRDAEVLGTDDPNYAISMLNKGTAYRRMGNYAEAEKNLDEAIEVLGDALGQQSLNYLIALGQKAVLYREQGKFEESEAVLTEVIKGIKSVMGQESYSYTIYLQEQGVVQASQDELKSAQKTLARTRSLRAKVLGTSHPRYAETTRQLAVVLWQAEKADDALEAYQETFANYFDQIDAFFPALSEPEKAKFYNNTLKVTFEEFNSFAMAHRADKPSLSGDMYNYQLATKALLMYSTSKVRTAILNSGDSTLIGQFNNWLALKERISKLYSMSAEEQAQQPESLATLVERANRLEKSLGDSSQEFAQTFTESRVTWQQVRDQLDDGEAAIEIIRYRQFSPQSAGQFTGDVRYAALVVRHDTQSQPEVVLLDNGNELEDIWIAYYRNSILYQLIDQNSYAQFWSPLKPALEGISKVYLSPDGVYHQISFNTLLNPQTGDFLVDEIAVERVTNTRDLIAYGDLSQEGMRTGKAFLFGFPNYNLGLDAETLAAAEVAQKVANTVTLDRGLRGSLARYVQSNELLAMLPGTKTEVETIGQLYQANHLEANLYLENEAIEEQLKQMEAPRTLHIATHGFFLEDNPEASADNDDQYVGNPLLRSGLILAGANTFIASGINESPLTEEDGILTAFEVLNLNLDATDLVVLSACETGLGEIKNGEGVYGLQRAFRVAGADAVVMSMWSVNDQATQELMSLFYKHWLESGDKQSAFQKAQNELRQKFPEPYYWGAFVMVGR